MAQLIIKVPTSKLGEVCLFERSVDPLNPSDGLLYLLSKHGAEQTMVGKSRFHREVDVQRALSVTVMSGILAPVQPPSRTGVRYLSKWGHMIGSSFCGATCSMEVIVVRLPVLHIVNGFPVPCRVRGCKACQRQPPPNACSRNHVTVGSKRILEQTCACEGPYTILPEDLLERYHEQEDPVWAQLYASIDQEVIVGNASIDNEVVIVDVEGGEFDVEFDQIIDWTQKAVLEMPTGHNENAEPARKRPRGEAVCLAQQQKIVKKPELKEKKLVDVNEPKPPTAYQCRDRAEKLLEEKLLPALIGTALEEDAKEALEWVKGIKRANTQRMRNARR